MPSPKKPRARPATQGVSKRDAFLAAYRIRASITRAAEDVGVERQLHYRWLDDEDYAMAFEQAKREAAEALEDEAVRRAHEGVSEPVIFQGQLCFEPEREKDGRPKRDANGYIKLSKTPLTVNKRSDSLLMFLLKGNKPEKYRETFKGELTLPRALTLTEKKLAALTDDELAQLTAIAQKLTSVSTTGEGSGEAETLKD